MIPNFCLGSQPSEIPLILHGLPFGFQPIEARYIFFHNFYFFLTHTLPFFNFFNYLLFLFFLSLSFFSSPLFFFLQIWLQERLRLLQPPTVPLSTYLPRHLRDRRLRDVLGFEAYM